MNKCITNMNQRSDKQYFLELNNSAFNLPRKFEFQAHKGDEVGPRRTIGREWSAASPTMWWWGKTVGECMASDGDGEVRGVQLRGQCVVVALRECQINLQKCVCVVCVCARLLQFLSFLQL